MTNLVRIPMSDLVFDELDDAFIDDDKQTAHDFVWGLIRNICKDAKLGKLNKTCTVNIIKDGQQAQDQIKLKGYELAIVDSDPNWIPENMDKEDIKYFEHKVTDKTWEYIKLYCSFAVLRHTKYCESLEKDNEKKLIQMINNNSSENMFKDAKENFSKSISKFKEGTPKLIEEILFNAIYPFVHRKVTENIEKEFDKENEEMYPKKEAVKKTA